MSIKFLLLGGGGVFWVFGGGGECRFYFYGREDFSDMFFSDNQLAARNRAIRFPDLPFLVFWGFPCFFQKSKECPCFFERFSLLSQGF